MVGEGVRQRDGTATAGLDLAWKRSGAGPGLILITCP